VVCLACTTTSDAGTDCALGEIFTCEIQPGVEKFHVEVIAKHTLTGDDYIGAATLSLPAGPALLLLLLPLLSRVDGAC